MTFKFLIGLLMACLLANGSALADERPLIKPPLQRQLEALVLPEVRFRDIDFMDALLYLQMKAQQPPRNAMRVPFVVNLPADFKPRYELSLDLKSVPFWEALRHLCGQAGVEFFIEHEVVTIRPAGSASVAKATVRTELPPPAAPAPSGGLAGPLGKPAQPMAGGDHVHRAMSGDIQPEKSGYIEHRNLSGWSVPSDPWHETSENCVNMAKCKANRSEKCDCGCRICACRISGSEAKKSPPQP